MKTFISFLRSGWNSLQGIKRSCYYYADLYLKRTTPVIVYQMGKVGSSSLRGSLKLHKVDFVFHVHRMDLDNIRRVQKEYQDNNQRTANEKVGVRLYRSIVRKHRKAKFITLVREPISRNMSAFFENFQRFTGTEYGEADFSIEELVDIFITDYKHWVPLTWFDVEMKQTLGIDVYEYPFPKEKGNLTIKKGNFELLILKLEVNDSIKEKAIAEFLNIDDFKLIKSNVAQDKDYSTTYRDLIRTIKLPESYVELMCNSEYMRQFYSDVEIESVRSKWHKRIEKRGLPPAVHQELLRAAYRDVN